MANLNLNPEFGALSKKKSNISVEETLKDREDYIRNRTISWNYQRYAYFTLSSVKPPKPDDADDKETIMFLVTEDNFSGQNSIGTTKAGNFTNGKSAFIESFYKNDDIRLLKPKLDSAKISVQGGDSLYDSYIKEVEVSFTIYSLDDLDLVEKSFFLPGAKAIVNYGWLDEDDPNLNGELEIRVYNFSYTMGTDGSFSCNISGLTPGFFVSEHTAANYVELTDAEKNALGKNSGVNATIPQAIRASCWAAFGVKVESDGSTTIPSKSQVAKFEMKSAQVSSGKLKGIEFYTLTLFASDQTDTYWFGDSREQQYFYISLFDLVKCFQLQLTGKERFEFSSEEKYVQITSPTPKDAFGSADPRKYILPGFYGIYTPFGTAGGWNYLTTIQNLPENGFGTNETIHNILISINVIDSIYKKIHESVEKVNETQKSPKSIEFFRKLSDEIVDITGGLVNIQFIKSDDDDNKFIIINQTSVDKTLKREKPAYTFSVLDDNSIVRNVSLNTDFDVSKMLQMTIGNVRAGEIPLFPFKTSFPDKFRTIDIEVDKATKQKIDDIKKSSSDTANSKFTFFQDGVDDSKVNSLKEIYKKALQSDGNGSEEPTLNVQVPYNLKLSISIDGIDNIGFLEPITIDRLPSAYKKDNVRFLVTGLEHSFDGQGDWETSIDTVMVIGKIAK